MIDPRDLKYFTLAVGSGAIKSSTANDIAVRCPHCSANPRWKNTKRLHLYEKNGVTNINCFTGDCPVKNKSVFSYLRDYHPTLLEGYKRETFTDKMQDLVDNKKSGDSGVDVFAAFAKKKEPKESLKEELLLESVELVEVEPPVNTFDLSEYFFTLDEHIDGQKYVEGRGFDFKLIQEKFGKMYVGKMDLELNDKPYPLLDSVIIPLYASTNVMYGFYSRKIHVKDFYTFNPDNNIGYKVWNFFNIDKEKDAYIFEGIFDAISFAVSSGNYNVIATMGAQLNQDRLNELKSPIFVLDNDISGFKNGLNYVRQGKRVFIQPKSIPYKDMNIMFQKGINCGELVTSNIFSGIFAEIELKTRM